LVEPRINQEVEELKRLLMRKSREQREDSCTVRASGWAEMSLGGIAPNRSEVGGADPTRTMQTGDEDGHDEDGDDEAASEEEPRGE
jgi:hypothetical protein